MPNFQDTLETLKRSFMSLLNHVPCVPYVPAWSTCPRANVPKACQFIIFTCQRANKRTKVPTCQRRANYSTWCANVLRAKGVPIFQFGVSTFLISLTFENFQNIWANVEYLSGETKNLNFGICKIPYQRETFHFVFNRAHGIN